MGSEMCIRDSPGSALKVRPLSSIGYRDPGFCDVNPLVVKVPSSDSRYAEAPDSSVFRCCLLYTSDAADERSSVDLGGRRIIKKKKKTYTTELQWN